jgi:hypothetical protein
MLWRLNSQTNLIPVHLHYGENDIAINHYAIAHFTTENKHLSSSLIYDHLATSTIRQELHIVTL